MPINQTLFRYVLLLILCLSSTHNIAMVFVIPDNIPSYISLTVGSPTQTSTLVFNLNNNQLGDGTPIRSRPRISIRIISRTTSTRALQLLVNSESPLVSNTDTLSFQNFYWESNNSMFPSGQLLGSPNQLLLTALGSQRIRSNLRFFYDNQTVIQAGHYIGTISYTLVLP